MTKYIEVNQAIKTLFYWLYILCSAAFFSILNVFVCVGNIEEVSRKKPRQTVVIVLRGKIAAHMASFRLCSRQVYKRRAGSNMRGDICILHFLL